MWPPQRPVARRPNRRPRSACSMPSRIGGVWPRRHHHVCGLRRPATGLGPSMFVVAGRSQGHSP
eukprot:7032794-Lingulodinium_polyedra.AAC.1